DGSLKECFGMGTAAVIAPVGAISYKDKEYAIGNNQVGPLSQQLFDLIVGIQNGFNEDTFGWTKKVE
ncbi:MAG: branched-chain amino acid aminotransferase, partial [Promethearchaeota archaeon]